MINRSRTLVLAASALVLAAGLAGCSTAAPSSPSKSATPTSDASSDKVALDPLQAYLMPDHPADAGLGEKYEQALKACMEEQGFEYTPMPDSSESDTTYINPPRDWIAEHGRGLVEHDIGIDFSIGDGDRDPNTAYLDSLSPAEKSAYDAAKYGKTASTDSQVDWKSLTWEERGCDGKAGHEVYPQLNKPRPAIIDDAQQFLTSLRTNPEVVALDDKVAACMNDAGYADAGRPRGGNESKGGVTGWTADYFEYRNSHSPLKADDPEVIKFKKLEIAEALADWDCKDKTDYDKHQVALYTHLEKDYIAEHKSELEEAKLWLNQ